MRFLLARMDQMFPHKNKNAVFPVALRQSGVGTMKRHLDPTDDLLGQLKILLILQKVSLPTKIMLLINGNQSWIFSV